ILSNGTAEFDPTVIILSFDGFRAEYLNRGLTPNILSVGANGIHVEYMQPSFPTLTFPNHYTIVTGLYPSNHGIVANTFYDPDLGDDFNYGIPAKSWNPKWWGGEPLWETAVNQNQRSGVIMWPGGEVTKDVRPTYHIRYKSGVAAQEKLQTVLGWLDKPREERPTVIAAYINEVDSTGHDFGPEGKRTQKAIGEVDSALGVFLQGLRERNLDKVVNLVLVSDHGMSYVNNARCIYYDDYLDTSDLLFEESLQPHLGVWTKDAKKLNGIYHTLKRVQRKNNLPFQVYRREDLPARFHYNHNNRIPPVIAVANPGYVLTRRDMGLAAAGFHGWDPAAEDMHAILMASGPSFPNQGPEKLHAIENVELYEVLARTVGL
ncbi:MAG: alkaline-phosphatase-like protein, partial [Benniella sp.]